MRYSIIVLAYVGVLFQAGCICTHASSLPNLNIVTEANTAYRPYELARIAFGDESRRNSAPLTRMACILCRGDFAAKTGLLIRALNTPPNSNQSNRFGVFALPPWDIRMEIPVPSSIYEFKVWATDSGQGRFIWEVDMTHIVPTNPTT